ncbi:MAG: endonuclease domain-containing protein [Dehalococcoidia bacterium]
MTYRDGVGLVTLLARCRELRREATDAEALLWDLLRGRQLAGAKFRRQHQFGRYILDFYCHASRLAIEVDGAHHASQAEQDAERTSYLEAHGLRVVRFTNRDVLLETETVLQAIWSAVAEST